MWFLILALTVAVNTFHGFAPVPLIVTVTAQDYSGAVCVSVDGPEYHRSCVARDRTSAKTRQYPFMLGTPGTYEVSVEDSKGNKYTGIVVEVL